MEIITVNPRGYCKGVVRAIQLAKKTKLDHPLETVTVLGDLVHNQDVIEQLEALDIHTIESKNKTRLELLDQVNEGIVIFTAHGINPNVKEKALNKGLKIVDASCEDVVSTQELVEKYLMEDYEILYIGKNGHPESEAICTVDTERIHLIEKLEDLDQLVLKSNKLFLTNQTTVSLLDIQGIIDQALIKYPNLIVSNEVCSATRLRQEAILNLETVDALIVVGDLKSNNTKMLAKIAENKGIPHVYLIQRYQQLSVESLSALNKIAITAGASTPTFLVNQVVAYCNAIKNKLNPYEEASKIKPFI